MANTINDLYLKYVNKVGRSLENDRYFQYLFEMVQAGSNVLQQKHQILHKVVDERWLTTIEESLDAIVKIIDNPRRFVTTEEEVVPVELARKITADSVRHLSMNTQFIAGDDGGNIYPTRILNVSTTESFDLYENRFIYHLIQRLVAFIDKRTDVIFWSTGDETSNTLSLQSSVDDAYETIDYKLEMTVKNRQSFAENDSENMQVFMRIDRVRRRVMALRHSPFCSLMAGCAKVRSPIQRTNLMMKDPSYRTCYKLWQFLESYDEVGYTIDVQDKALEFDEEYLLQLYTNLITNYTVFKSLLEADPRRLDEVPPKRRRVIRPKFIKQIKEEFVDDYNIPDVEIRKVFIDEVTQVQLDAEAALAEEQEKNRALESALADTEDQLQTAFSQLNTAMQRAMEAETRADEETQAHEATKALLEQTRTEAETQLRELQADAESRVRVAEAARASAEEVARVEAESRRQAEDARIQAEADARAAAEAQTAAETETARIRTESAAAIEEIRRDARETVERTQAEAEQTVRETKAQAEEETTRIRTEAENTVAEMKAQTLAETTRVREAAEAAVSEAKTARASAEKRAAAAEETIASALAAQKAAEERANAAEQSRRLADKERTAAEKAARLEAQARREADARAERIRQTAESKITLAEQARTAAEERSAAAEAARTEAEIQRFQADSARVVAEEAAMQAAAAQAEAEQRAEEAVARAVMESKARIKAQERADANSLSKYIVSRLRKRENQDKQE